MPTELLRQRPGVRLHVRHHFGERASAAWLPAARAGLALLALLAPPAGAAQAPAAARLVTVERERYLMGTRARFLLQGEDAGVLESAAGAAFDEIARLEQVSSNWRDDSELNALHRAALADPERALPVSRDLFNVLARARDWQGRSGGAFDATVEPLTRAYDLRGRGRS